MFGLPTIIDMNKRAAAQIKEAPALKLGRNKKLHPATCVDAQPKRDPADGGILHGADGNTVTLFPGPEVDVDFQITSKGPNGGLMVTPHTDAAKALLKRMFAYSEDYRGASVMLKHRDLPSLLFTINVAKLTVLRQ